MAARSFLIVLAVLGVVSCRGKGGPAPIASGQPLGSGKPLDHLALGELAAGKSQVFGFEVPREMSITGQFPDVAYLGGRVSADAVANYVRERVEVGHVEIGAARTVFPNARIKRGSPEKQYDFEITREGLGARLVIRDTTPRPSEVPQGTSEEERWRRAGRGPDGRILDPLQLR